MFFFECSSFCVVVDVVTLWVWCCRVRISDVVWSGVWVCASVGSSNHNTLTGDNLGGPVGSGDFKRAARFDIGHLTLRGICRIKSIKLLFLYVGGGTGTTKCDVMGASQGGNPCLVVTRTFKKFITGVVTDLRDFIHK